MHTHKRCVIYVNKSLNFKALPHNSFIFVFSVAVAAMSASLFICFSELALIQANERTLACTQPCVQFQQSSCNKWIFIQMSCLTISFIFLLMVFLCEWDCNFCWCVFLVCVWLAHHLPWCLCVCRRDVCTLEYSRKKLNSKIWEFRGSNVWNAF